MLVNDLPSGVPSVQTHRLTHPEADLSSRRLGGSSHLQEAVAKCEVAAHRESEIAGLQIDRTLPRISVFHAAASAGILFSIPQRERRNLLVHFAVVVGLGLQRLAFERAVDSNAINLILQISPKNGMSSHKIP